MQENCNELTSHWKNQMSSEQKEHRTDSKQLGYKCVRLQQRYFVWIARTKFEHVTMNAKLGCKRLVLKRRKTDSST